MFVLNGALLHFDRRLFTGFTSAALMPWKLIVPNATPNCWETL